MSDVNRIKAVLAEQKVSSKLLAIYMKKAIGTVSRWCNNKSQPHVNDLNKIAEFLKVDIRELLVSSEWEPGPSPAALLKMQKLCRRALDISQGLVDRPREESKLPTGMSEQEMKLLLDNTANLKQVYSLYSLFGRPTDE